MRKRASHAEWSIVTAPLLIAFALRTVGVPHGPLKPHNEEVVAIQIIVNQPPYTT